MSDLSVPRRIARIQGYALVLPFSDGYYGMSGGRGGDELDTTVVAVHCDDGKVGWGEMATLGTYAPAFGEGARAALPRLAAALLDLDPLQSSVVNAHLDAVLNGHPYAKSALDIACWDLAGKVTELALCQLLGGQFGETVDVYRAISFAEPETMADEARRFVEAGYKRIQVKVGEDPATDIDRVRSVRRAVGDGVTLFADANGGWITRDARLFIAGLGDETALVLEQPCQTIVECAQLRSTCPWPIVLDESIVSVEALIEAYHLAAVDGITIKLSRVGGITKARVIRDAAVALRVPVTIEDTGGAEIDTAAITHMSLSTPTPLRIHTYPFHELVSRSTADGMPRVTAGTLGIPPGSGLGITPRLAELGTPVFDTGT